jgi:uncharacterized protein (DUF736 family)
VRELSSPGARRALLAGQESALPASFAAASALAGAAPDLAAADVRLSRPQGAASRRNGDFIMAQIGTFSRDENGVLSGSIRTLTLNVKATIRPVDREHDKAPDHRVFAGAVEIGAGWSKTARETGAEYLSLKLDDPSLPSPIYAQLVQGDGTEHKLIWSR